MKKDLFAPVVDQLPDQPQFDLTSSRIESSIGKPLSDSYFKYPKSAFHYMAPLGKVLLKKNYVVDSFDINAADRTFVLHIVKVDNVEELLSRKKKRKQKSTQPLALKYNEDLPENVLKDENGVVIINRQNANLIKHEIENHVHYSYVSFVKKVFENTKPANNKQPSIDDVVTRLVVIDNIDGTNLSRNFGSGGYRALAKSIIDAKLENLIRNKQPITNKIFQKIALRKAIVQGEKPLKLFSVVSKYISRTAIYVYKNIDCYPIFDNVLKDNLFRYIPSMTPELVSTYKETLDYESYRKGINDYLATLNQGLRQSDSKYINNSEFDQIVWFSYKAANAKPKFK